MHSFDRGVIYTAIGENYIREAQLSARSVRTFLPDTRIVLFTDSPPEDKNAFDDVIRLENLNRRPQLDNSPALRIHRLQYAVSRHRYLILRLSVRVVRSSGGIRHRDGTGSSLLRFFPGRRGGTRRLLRIQSWGRGVQAVGADAEDGSGLAGLGEGFLQQTGIPIGDQVPMRIALYTSDLRIATLPQEFNCRFHSFGYLNGKVKILHGKIRGGEDAGGKPSDHQPEAQQGTIPRVFVAGQLYVLARRHFFAIEHTFPRRVATSFRPWPVLCTALLKRVVQKAERLMKRLLRRLRKA